MVSVVSSNPTGGNFIFLRHLDANFVQKWQKCQICVIYENLDCQYYRFCAFVENLDDHYAFKVTENFAMHTIYIIYMF